MEKKWGPTVDDPNCPYAAVEGCNRCYSKNKNQWYLVRCHDSKFIKWFGVPEADKPIGGPIRSTFSEREAERANYGAPDIKARMDYLESSWAAVMNANSYTLKQVIEKMEGIEKKMIVVENSIAELKKIVGEPHFMNPK